MKTIRQLTLTVITALFVVTVALLWASASPKAIWLEDKLPWVAIEVAPAVVAEGM